MRLDDVGDLSPTITGAWSRAMARLEELPRRRRRTALAELLVGLRPEEVGIVASFTAGILLPSDEMERAGVTPAILRAAFANVTGKTADELAELAARAGGYAEITTDVLTPTVGAGRISLLQVRSWLSELLGYAREPLEMMVFLLKTLEPLMSRYLVRAMLGELPIGLEVGAVLEAVATASRIEREAVAECFELTNDIDDTAERAFRGRRALAQVHCRTGRPYRLMPVTPAASIAQVFESGEGPFLIEAEVPGVRLEVHRRHSSIQLFTRRLKDVTRAFPEIAAALERSLIGTDDLILEGQVFQAGVPAFQSERAVQARLGQMPTQRGAVLKPEVPLTLALFDLTRQGREDLMERPTEERRRRLRQLFRVSDRLVCPEVFVTEDAEAAEAFYQNALEAGAPGVILKAARRGYVAGRQNVWYRVGAEPARLDLAVIGASFNAAGAMTRLTLACQADGGLTPMAELSSNGAEPELWRGLQSQVRSLVSLDRGDKAVVKPGLVLEVEARALKRSPRRPSGASATGLLLKQVREDKGPFEADSAAFLQRLLDITGAQDDTTEAAAETA